MASGLTWENSRAKTDYNSDPLSQLLEKLPCSTIPYRPVLKHLIGDVNAAILLQQIVFRFIGKGRKPFYKLAAPSTDERHPLYRPGDSWVEELGFSEDEYRQALKKIATRVRKKERSQVLSDTAPEFGLAPDGRNKHQTILLNRQHLVAYWREADNVLRFELNVQLLTNALLEWNKRLEPEIPCSEDGKSVFENGDFPVSYNRDNHIDTSKSDPADTANADAAESASRGLESKTASTEQSKTQESYSTPRARANKKKSSKRDKNISYNNLSRLGKFLVFVSNKGANIPERTQTKTLTARQADALATEVSFYHTNGEYITVSPNDLFDAEPHLQKWLERVVYPFLRGRQGTSMPIARDKLINVLTLEGSDGYDIRSYYEWRESQKHLERLDAESYIVHPDEDVSQHVSDSKQTTVMVAALSPEELARFWDDEDETERSADDDEQE